MQNTFTHKGKEYPINEQGAVVLWGLDVYGNKCQRSFRVENTHWNWTNIFKRNFLTEAELDAYVEEESQRIALVREREEPYAMLILNSAKMILDEALQRIEEMGVKIELLDTDEKYGIEFSYHSQDTYQSYHINKEF